MSTEIQLRPPTPPPESSLRPFPDDYGVDTPTLLMDSDASDSSPFGPRRIGIDECTRAVRQSGPKARVPLLEPWPLTPMRY